MGYCQGLPFCVGMLLMHVEEEEAFSLLRFLMFRVGLRRQFHPDMAGLQVTLYTTNMCPLELVRKVHIKVRNHGEGPY